jgi:hypothetical protein
LCDAYIHVTEQGFEGQGGMSKQGFEGQGEMSNQGFEGQGGMSKQGFEGQGGMSKQGFEGQGERRRRARLCKPRWGEEINMCSNMQKISANICAK